MVCDVYGTTPGDSIPQKKYPQPYKKKLPLIQESDSTLSELLSSYSEPPRKNAIKASKPKGEMIMKYERAKELSSPELRADFQAVEKGEMSLDEFMQKWKIGQNK